MKPEGLLVSPNPMSAIGATTTSTMLTGMVCF